MSLTNQKKHMSRRELEELKKKRDEEETAEVFGEFVAAFTDDPTARANKAWVRAGTFDAGSRSEDTKDKGQLYRPKMKHVVEPKKEALLGPLFPEEKIERPKKKKVEEKKKSNLELFKEELQR
jgi:U2-associated protein SR140